MKKDTIPEPVVVAPAFVVEQQAALARERVAIEQVIDQTPGPPVTAWPLMFTLTLALPMGRQPLSQIESITVGHLLGQDAADNKVKGCMPADLGQLEGIVLQINGCYLGEGTLMRWKEGWGLRITRLAQQLGQVEEKGQHGTV